MFQYVLCVSRFAHYLKVLGRELIGARVTAAECERILRSWLMDHTTSDDNALPAVLAERPLREARIEVRDNLSVSGGFLCRAWLKPHFLMDRLIPAFELTTELGRPGEAEGTP
jgi:type VI secretion system protein ImpD